MMQHPAYRFTRDGLIVIAVAWAAWNTHVLNANRTDTAGIGRAAAKEAIQSHRALCSLRGDLSQRVDGSRAFLKTHPHGFFGIPAAEIQRSIDNEQRTIDALRFLKCPL